MDIGTTIIIGGAAIVVAQIVGRSLVKLGTALETSAAANKDMAYAVSEISERLEPEIHADEVTQTTTIERKYDAVDGTDNVFVMRPKP